MNQRESSKANASYRIVVKGRLDPSWQDWFDGFTISPQSGDETVLEGTAIDQAALYGILFKLRDLRLDLLFLRRLESGMEKDSLV